MQIKKEVVQHLHQLATAQVESLTQLTSGLGGVGHPVTSNLRRRAEQAKTAAAQMLGNLAELLHKSGNALDDLEEVPDNHRS